MVRILRCGGGCHRKNEEGMRLMTSAIGAEYVESNDRECFKQDWDIVFIPSEYIGPENFPNARRIIYGPHNFVFPEGMWLNLDFTSDKRIYYNVLCKWNKGVYSEVSQFEKNMNMAILPFAVNVERFKPAEEKVYERDCFIYFKDRDLQHLEFVKNICSSRGLNYEIIIYGSYNEDHYRHVLNTSKFCIWVGRHESQGFAVQEALSMNIPLVVWDVKSMLYEIVRGHKQYGYLEARYKLEASVLTTWDDTCGIIADENNIDSCIDKMVIDYKKYGGRELIVHELSPIACMNKWLEFIKNSSLNNK